MPILSALLATGLAISCLAPASVPSPADPRSPASTLRPQAREEAAPPPAQPSSQTRPAGPAEVTWDQMMPHFEAAVGVVKEDAHHWLFTVLPPESAGFGGRAPADERLQAAALEALDWAKDDLAWLVGEVTTRRLVYGTREIPVGRAERLPQAYIGALLGDPSFCDPLRRYTDAAVRTRGMTCRDCLSGLRASRDVTWSQVREYLAGFIYVSHVDENGRVDLRVGGLEHGLPSLAGSDHDLGGAIFALMQTVSREAPEFQTAVQTALASELDTIQDLAPAEVRTRLNQRLPEAVLKDPAALRPILDRLASALDRHGLRCSDCWRRRPGS